MSFILFCTRIKINDWLEDAVFSQRETNYVSEFLCGKLNDHSSKILAVKFQFHQYVTLYFHLKYKFH